MFDNIAVIGLGLIGGSICKSIKKKYKNINITAYGRSLQKLKPALDDGSVDSISGFEEMSLNGVGLVIISTPVISSIQLIDEILSRPDFDDNALVIDVGSVKEPILKKIAHSSRASNFIGCHPMAGSDESGFRFSSDTLFQNASVLITPSEINRVEDIRKITVFWESLGSRVTIVPADIHDKHVAYTSHTPHIISCMIVKILMGYLSGRKDEEPIRPFIGKGFLDTTRISASSPDMWQEIIELNKSNISDSLKNMISQLEEISHQLEGLPAGSGKMHSLFSEVKEFRDTLK